MFTIAGGIILAVGVLAIWLTIAPPLMDSFWAAMEYIIEYARQRTFLRITAKIVGFCVLVMTLFFIESLFHRGPLSGSFAPDHQPQASSSARH